MSASISTSPAAAPLLCIERLTRTFGVHRAVDEVSLEIAAGEFVCLLGPSGCGKTTLLRMLAGFERPDAGTIRLDGEDLTGVAPHRRPVNMMFQSYALFPHMSVAGNLAYGLKGLGLARSQIAERVAALLRLVRLEGYETRRPDTLSGGQRQRVALARALAREPRLLLLDEPLGALDRALREQTQVELRAIQRRLGTGFVVVTHDPEEAMALADRIVAMDRGRVVQAGPSRLLYERPETRFVAGLLGDVNLIAGTLGERDGEARRVHTTSGIHTALPAPAVSAAAAGTSVLLALRPERLQLGPGDNTMSGTLVDTAYLGDRVRRQIRLVDGTTLRASASVPGDAGDAGLGEPVQVGFARDAGWILPA